MTRTDQDLSSARQLTLTVYILQALAFLVGFSAIAGVIINYIKRDDVAGTWLASHFRWQIRTFWFALLGYCVAALTMVILVGWLIGLLTTIWVVYRVVAGWLKLSDGEPMYIEN